MYVDPDFTTKKALREAIANGTIIEVYEPGLGTVPANGRIFLEGPHYPRAHTWYAEGTMKDGKLIKIK
jgi:hypothetical protein